MKKTTRPQRPAADDTRNKILKCALKLFIQHGFAGTSMGKLAEMADINQSLIFHHFSNKENLWKQAKASLLDDIEINPINLQPETLTDFLSAAVQQRVSIYNKHPELIRLVSWQRLEPKKRLQLSGIQEMPTTGYEQWLIPIEHLQKQGKLNKTLKPDLIIVWLLTSINGLIVDDLNLFKIDSDNRENYTKMIINGLALGLK